MKKALRFLAIVMACALCFMSAGCSKPSEDEVLKAYKELYPKAIEITRIVYGAGLPYDGEYDQESINGSYFVKVSESSPYKTRSELEAAILSVYSEELYRDVLESVLFGGVESDDNGLFGITPRYKETDGTLYIDIGYEQFVTITERDYENARVDEIRSRSATLKVPYTVGGAEKIKKITVVLTENGWRLDEIA